MVRRGMKVAPGTRKQSDSQGRRRRRKARAMRHHTVLWSFLPAHVENNEVCGAEMSVVEDSLSTAGTLQWPFV